MPCSTMHTHTTSKNHCCNCCQPEHMSAPLQEDYFCLVLQAVCRPYRLLKPRFRHRTDLATPPSSPMCRMHGNDNPTSRLITTSTATTTTPHTCRKQMHWHVHYVQLIKGTADECRPHVQCLITLHYCELSAHQPARKCPKLLSCHTPYPA